MNTATYNPSTRPVLPRGPVTLLASTLAIWSFLRLFILPRFEWVWASSGLTGFSGAGRLCRPHWTIDLARSLMWGVPLLVVVSAAALWASYSYPRWRNAYRSSVVMMVLCLLGALAALSVSLIFTIPVTR